MKKNAVLSFTLFALIASSLLGSEWDINPEPQKTVIPVLDTSLSDDNGYVELLVETNPYGYVTHAEVKSTSNESYVTPCLDAIYQWKYKPAHKNGEKVSATFIQPIRFNEGVYATSVAKQEKKQNKVNKDPRALRKASPELTDDLKHITGNAVVEVSLDKQGRISNATVVNSSHEELSQACIDAVAHWTFSPAIESGKAVPAKVHVPFVFKGEPMKNTIIEVAEIPADRAPKLIRQKSPRVPSELSAFAGEVQVSFIVDEYGYVSSPEIISASHQELAQLASDAVLGWKFKPAIKDGQAVAVKTVQPFIFNGGIVSTEAVAKVDRLPVIRRTVSPEVPEELEAVEGFVLVQFSIDDQGNVTAVEATDASLAELKEPTLDAARKWKFKPALKAGNPTESKVVVPFQYKARG